MEKKTSKKILPVIGPAVFVSVDRSPTDIPAKIDTGADSSSIWATQIKIDKDNVLSFRLFSPRSPFYTGKTYHTKDYEVAVVRSAMGHEQVRYRAHLPLTIEGRTIRVLFNLSDRSRNNFPVLIGKRTLSGKFIVDVSRPGIRTLKNPRTATLQKELKHNPQAFHNKHMKGANS